LQVFVYALHSSWTLQWLAPQVLTPAGGLFPQWSSTLHQLAPLHELEALQESSALLWQEFQPLHVLLTHESVLQQLLDWTHMFVAEQLSSACAAQVSVTQLLLNSHLSMPLVPLPHVLAVLQVFLPQASLVHEFVVSHQLVV
jgi:hypothetical protein